MEKKSFEILMNDLEKLVTGLESGEIELDKALVMYKQGIDIIEKLNKRLSDAKKQVEIIEKSDASEPGDHTDE